MSSESLRPVSRVSPEEIQVLALSSGSEERVPRCLAVDDADLSHTNIAQTPTASGDGDNWSSAADDRAATIQVKEYQDFRATGFANKHELARWFPQIEFDEKKSWRIWISKRSRALLINTATVGAIFLVNFGLTIFATLRYPRSNGVGIIYEGDCDTVKHLSLWIHLLINLLSTAMLSASNYCMQLQVAPTRENVNRAHDDGRWLDIGVPSLRNFWYVGNWRRLYWLVLATSSVPIHFTYNSAVFSSLGSSVYTVAVVNNAFLSGGTWSLAAAESRRENTTGWSSDRANPSYFNYQDIIENMQQTVLLYENAVSHSSKNVTSPLYSNATAQQYTAMNASTCFDYYDNYWTAQGNVIILVRNLSVQVQVNDSLLIYTSIIPRSDDWAKNLWALGNGTGAFIAQPPQSPVDTWYLGPPRYEVDHCLVQEPANNQIRCRFEYSFEIMIAICILNLSKTLIMTYIWATRKRQSENKNDSQKVVLYTLGDAIASFMREPDKTTEKMCLATKDDFRRKRSSKNRATKEDPQLSQKPREWKYTAKFWMSAAGVRKWVTLILPCVLILVVATILLWRSSFVSLRHRSIDISISALWNLGFGAPAPYTYIILGLPQTDPLGLISNVLLANLPQFILSILYIFYNSMLSCFLVQKEFSRMHNIRKPLRVSEPEGIQRSSYFISLPLRYGIPLYVAFGIMHWLISQSLFLARITAYLPDGTVDQNSTFSTSGYSPIALIITLNIGAVLVLVIMLVGLRTFNGTMPLVSTNSRAISAACHVLSEDRAHGYLLPVQWGVVKIEGGVGHASFTTAHDIRKVEAHMKYA